VCSWAPSNTVDLKSGIVDLVLGIRRGGLNLGEDLKKTLSAGCDEVPTPASDSIAVGLPA